MRKSTNKIQADLLEDATNINYELLESSSELLDSDDIIEDEIQTSNK